MDQTIGKTKEASIQENQGHRQDRIGPRREKTCLRGFAYNKAADQPAHPCSLTNAFVVRSFALSETPKAGSVTSRAILY